MLFSFNAAVKGVSSLFVQVCPFSFASNRLLHTWPLLFGVESEVVCSLRLPSELGFWRCEVDYVEWLILRV